MKNKILHISPTITGLRSIIVRLINYFNLSSKLLGSPKGYIEDSFQWCEKYRHLDPNTGYEIIYPAHYVKRSLPISLEGQIHSKFRNISSLEVKIPDCFIVHIPNGRYFCTGTTNGLIGNIITPDDYLLYDLSHDFGKRPQEYKIFNTLKLPSSVTINKCVAVLSTPGADTYYHWMFDLLPKIYMLNKSQRISFDDIDFFIINGNNSEYAVQMLEFLGVPEEKIIRHKYNMHILAECLVVPSMPSLTGNMPAWVCNYLNHELKPINDAGLKEYPEKIYISREAASSKKVINEYQVMEYLRQKGFVLIKPETMSVNEQVGVFSSAKIIVSPHGAAMANLVFCSAGTKVIEIFPPNYLNVCYWALCNQMDCEYFYILSDNDRSIYEPQDIKEQNIYIDIRKLQTILEYIVEHN